MSLSRLVLTALAALAVLWVLVVLAFGSASSEPTSGSGEGRFPGRTETHPATP